MNSRLLLSEMIWLEPEQIEQAKAMSNCSSPEAQQWESYLNALALLGFEQWLRDRLPEKAVERSTKLTDSACYIEACGFTLCLIAVEHILDETVRIPQAVVEQPKLTAHFYVLHEVSEEQELVTVRGFCRYEELIRDLKHCNLQDGYYELPLAVLDTEPNHLLFYCHFLHPAEIALPISDPAINQSLVALTKTTIRFTQWLQKTFNQKQAARSLNNNRSIAIELGFSPILEGYHCSFSRSSCSSGLD